MHLLEEKMHQAKVEISKQNFNKYGQRLKLFSGVNDWFKRNKPDDWRQRD